MTKKPTVRLTKFELEIMNALWPLERASIREVLEQLSDDRRPAYTTVQTIFRRLEAKGAVRRVRQIGSAFIYEPVLTQATMRRRVVDEILGMFDGSIQTLMSHLVETDRLSLEDIRALEEALDASEPRSGDGR